MRNIVFLSIAFIILCSSCQKDDSTPVSASLEIDEELIGTWKARFFTRDNYNGISVIYVTYTFGHDRNGSMKFQHVGFMESESLFIWHVSDGFLYLEYVRPLMKARKMAYIVANDTLWLSGRPYLRQ